MYGSMMAADTSTLTIPIQGRSLATAFVTRSLRMNFSSVTASGRGISENVNH
jgi:hypothetical protein